VTKKFTKSFIMRTGEMLKSPPYRALSLSGHRVLSRLEVELCRHGGKDNGRLPVTRENFREYGIDPQAINAALRELEALGFLEITQRGTVGKAGQRRPNLYRLSYLSSFGKDPTNEWQNILTVEDAEKIAKEARAKKLKSAPKPREIRWPPLSFEVEKRPCCPEPISNEQGGKICFSEVEKPPRLKTNEVEKPP
jgi:hypothetical protein